MAASNPLISVIIPAYNRAAYITDAINSVFNQEEAPWPLEVIVIDDGSTDNTEEVVTSQFGDKVRYVKIPQSGGRPAVPRNVGIKMAKGKLIAFHDSDDLWAPDKLRQQIPLFEQDKNLVLSYATAEIMNHNGKRSGQLVVPDMKHLAEGEQYEKLLTDNVISTLTVVARKDAIKKVGYFNEWAGLSAVEDYELWLRIAARFPGQLKAVAAPLAYYRQHSGNISLSDNAKALKRLTNVYSAQANITLTPEQRHALQIQTVVMQVNLGRLRDEPDTPLISVVMSVYNGERFLRPAIESILNQTYRAFEFIIIDDGSTDNTANIIQSYNDPRIRFVQRENKGLVYSLNQGVGMARGRFIARMDADDLALPSRFEKELAVLLSNEKIALVGCFFTYIDEASSKPGITITSPTESIDLKRAMFIYNPFPHGGSMFRREAYAEAGGYNNDFGPIEDYSLWMRMSIVGWECKVIPESLYLYRLSTQGISHNQKDAQAENGKRLINDYWSKHWVHKGVRTIVRGGRRYSKLDSPFANEMFHQYIHHQYVLA
ncbi:MAG TPA: glycosyltransferase family 2 protein, partial [Candidatus Saccharimonadales bacterium]|nr:glycosyltransferase family 2 protein [Candidatus Saccharimonadales bacterium]